MTNRGRVFQGVEYPSRREACQARHREYVRALADGLNFTQAAHAVVGGSFRAGCSGVGASHRVLRLSLVVGAGPAVSTSPPEGLGDSLSGGLPQCRMQFPEVRLQHEFTSLELQRLWTLLNVQVIELHAKLFGACRVRARARPRTRLSWAAVPLESVETGSREGGNAPLEPRHAGDTPTGGF